MGEIVDVVVVGGGLVGVCVAHRLAEQGASEIMLLEAGALGGGSTSGSMGGVRQQFGTAQQVEMSARSLEFWRSFEAEFGEELGFEESGYLLLSSQPTTYEKLRRSYEVQKSQGAYDVHLLGPDEISEIAPWLITDDLLGGVWTPRDGRMNPTDALRILAGRARSAGVRIVENAAVEQIERMPDGWLLRTEERTVQAAMVVVAAGIGTPALLEPFGLELPITPMRIPYAVTGPALQGQAVPLTLDLDTGLWVDRHGVGLTLTVFDPEVSGDGDAMLMRFAELAMHRAPALTEVDVRNTLVGVADATGGDGHAFIGEVEEGVWVISGFDAHGTMHAPAAAELLVGWIEGRDDPFFGREDFDPWRAPSNNPEWLRTEKKQA